MFHQREVGIAAPRRFALEIRSALRAAPRSAIDSSHFARDRLRIRAIPAINRTREYWPLRYRNFE